MAAPLQDPNSLGGRLDQIRADVRLLEPGPDRDDLLARLDALCKRGAHALLALWNRAEV